LWVRIPPRPPGINVYESHRRNYLNIA